MDFDENTKSNYIQYNSYLKKEEFIQMLQDLRFDAVRDARISLITGYINDDDDNIKALGYDINIE